jgi:hypothetical protein
MFNLEHAIAEWRRRMIKSGLKSSEFLAELESHLRDDIEVRIREGQSGEEAFTAAGARLGQPAALQHEFKKASTMNNRFQKALAILRTPLWTPHVSRSQLKYTVLTFAGIPGHYTDDARRSASGIEPGWATYLRGLLLMGPALFIWFSTRILILPKLKEIWLASRLDMPSLLRQILAGMDVTCRYWWAFAAGAVALLGLLEWRSRGWPRFRRTTMGCGIFTLNLCALLALAAIGILGILAAAQLASHR